MLCMVIFLIMGIPKDPENAILFTALLFHDEEDLKHAKERLSYQFGPIALESEIFGWSHSKYYSDEFGTELKRKFIVFNTFICPDEIADIKLLTNTIELEFSKNNKRAVNIDPGYLTLGKLVLASTKNYSHRIYLGKGIYAEVTLYYKHKDFHPTRFTFNDYKQSDYIEFFRKARDYLRKVISSRNR